MKYLRQSSQKNSNILVSFVGEAIMKRSLARVYQS